MNKKIKTEAVDHLFDAILSLQNKEECYAFFEDLCTVNELLSLLNYGNDGYELVFSRMAEASEPDSEQ